MGMETQRLDEYAARLSARIDALRNESAPTIDRQAFQAFAEHVPNILWTANPDGSIASFNKRYHEVTGLPHYDYLSIFHPEDAERCRAHWRSHVQAGVQYENRCRVRLTDGLYHWMVTRASPVRCGAGAVAYWIGSSTIVALATDLVERAA